MAELRPFHSILSVYAARSNARWGNLQNVPGDDHPISFSRQLAVTPPAIEDAAHIASNVVAHVQLEKPARLSSSVHLRLRTPTITESVNRLRWVWTVTRLCCGINETRGTLAFADESRPPAAAQGKSRANAD